VQTYFGLSRLNAQDDLGPKSSRKYRLSAKK